MAKEALLNHVPISASNIHRMRGEATPQRAAAEYEQELRQVFPSDSPVFDLILLVSGRMAAPRPSSPRPMRWRRRAGW